MNSLIPALITGIAITYIIILSFDKEESKMDANIRRRLKGIKNKVFVGSSQTSKKFKKNIQVLLQDTEYKVAIFGNLLNKIKITSTLKNMLKITDVQLTVDVFIGICIALAFPFILLGLLNPNQTAIMFSIGIMAAYIPVIILKIKIKKKIEKFSQQFPDALGIISSSLRAGHSLLASFQMVVHEMPYPINKIFKTASDEISLGGDVRDALDNMAKNVPGNIDLRFFITAVLIQREIGGNLAEILDSLSHTIRERFKLLGQLKAQTAQAKLSGILLAVAPVIIGGIIAVMNPSYLDPLLNTLTGKIALGGSIASAIIGYLVIQKITNIKV